MKLHNRLTSNGFVILAEMHTPKGINTSKLLRDAQGLKGRVDAVVIPDMDNGIMRMSGLGGGVLLQQQGIETVIHMYCRDRNRMALQGDLLAAAALGINTLLVVHSDEMHQTDHREAATVDDLSELELLEVIHSLQQGKDMGGFELDGRPSFTAGCTIAPFASASERDTELALVRQKVAAGAAFIITPPVFDLTAFSTLREQIHDLGVPIIPTVFLLKSLAIAQYIANSDPSARISDELIRRIRTSKDREREGMLIAAETIRGLREIAAGVMIQTLGWEDRIPTILDMANI